MSVAQQFAGHGFALTVGIGVAVSVAGVILVEYLALSRLTVAVTAWPLRRVIVGIGVIMVAAAPVLLVNPDEIYDHLLTLTRSPVVALNRAVAVAEAEGPEAALHAIAPLASDKRMLGYQPYWAARGHLLARTHNRTDAAEAFRVAIGLTTDDAVRAYLQGQLAGLHDA